MKTFTDAAGRTWTITLNLGTAMAVKAKLGVDLLQPETGDPPLLTRLGTDEMLLGEVLCALLEKQFETHKVTEDEVRAAFDGQTLLAATTRLLRRAHQFFPGARPQRPGQGGREADGHDRGGGDGGGEPHRRDQRGRNDPWGDVWRLAGAAGIDPDGLRGLTLRQLLWMAEGHGRQRWAHTSLICALVANCHRDPKKHRPFKPSDFDPYARSRNTDRPSRRTADRQSLALLREALEARPRKPQPKGH